MYYDTDYGIFSEFKFFFKALYFWVALQGRLPHVLLSVSFIPKHVLAQVQAHLFHISLSDVSSQPFLLFSFLLHCFNSLCSSDLLCHLCQSYLAQFSS